MMMSYWRQTIQLQVLRQKQSVFDKIEDGVDESAELEKLRLKYSEIIAEINDKLEELRYERYDSHE